MSKRAIPESILGQHVAILGKTGSGKTSTEKLAVEQVVGEGFRVCVLDAVKSDWWGITSSASGKHAGLPFKILGGPRGHVPLHSSAGKVIGQLVGSGKLPLSIIDMADFEPGGLQRFFVDFAPALMRHARGVVYLVIEEAHEFAPKERSGIGAENMAIHWAKKLATAGRSKGVRLIVATQRVQALHNAVLGSCETVIAHRLTTPADQEPVLKWLKANADKETLEKVAGSLSSLPTGTGWICSGEAKVFEKVQFPKFKTYDNTATPTGDDAEIDVKTAPVDQDELRAIIGEAVKVAEQSDPKALRARIAELELKMRDAVAVASKLGAPDPEAIHSAEVRGYARGVGVAIERFRAFSKDTGRRLLAANTAAETLRAAMLDHNVFVDAFEDVAGDLESGPLPPHNVRPGTPERKAIPPRAKPSPGAGGNGTISQSLQKVLDAIAWWRKIGFEPVERARASVVAGYSPKASTFGVYIAELVKLGLVEVSPGKVALTAAGFEQANAPTATTAAELREMARALLTAQEARVFDAVYDRYPKEIRRAEVAEAVGLSPSASTCGVYIAGVAAYGIIENAGRGAVRAAGWLFP